MPDNFDVDLLTLSLTTEYMFAKTITYCSKSEIPSGINARSKSFWFNGLLVNLEVDLNE